MPLSSVVVPASTSSIGDTVRLALDSILGYRQRRKYTVDNLRSLYADLLHLVNVADDDLGRRSLSKNDRPSQVRLSEDFSDFLTRSLSIVNSYQLDDSDGPPKRDLSAAFKVLSATTSAQKEGFNGGAVAIRDNAAVTSLALARARETRVVKLIRSIGEVVVYGEQSIGQRSSLRSDAVFEYFCEKSILSLLVDIAKSKPAIANSKSRTPNFHPVTWTPLVKAQVLHTVSILLSNVQDSTSLYYLLSNNHVNELVNCMLPMRQWTDPALEEMMPVYVSFLKTLSVKLTSFPKLFPFLKRDSADSVSFPLFSCALNVATSSFAQSNSSVYITCVHLIVSILQISHPWVRSWVSSAEKEQKLLAMHVCQRLVDRYQRLAQLATGPVLDPVRSSAVLGQLMSLQDEFRLLNDILFCGSRSLNVRICEFLLRRVVFKLLHNMLPHSKTRRLAFGVFDEDVVPEPQALAQASALFLSQLFQFVEYAPLLRMLAVAILHPLSPKECLTIKQIDETDEYVLTPALNKIVLKQNDEPTSEHAINNPFQEELLALLHGDDGDWRFIPAAMLLESILKSDALDLTTLQSLSVVPTFSTDEKYPSSPWEEAVGSMLCQKREKCSPVATMAMECAGSVALTLLSHVVASSTENGEVFDSFDERFRSSPLVQGIGTARRQFSAASKSLQQSAGVADHFLDLIELAIASQYPARTELDDGYGSGGSVYIKSLEKSECSQLSNDPNVLVRKVRHVCSNDVEDARFALRMTLHLRALCNVLNALHSELVSSVGPRVASPRWSAGKLEFGTEDVADELLITIGGLKPKPADGTDLDLRGRTTFGFSVATNRLQSIKPVAQETQRNSPRKRTFSEEIHRSPATKLILVLDPTDIFVVRPDSSASGERGTIICSTPLSSIIAFAPDGEWLHIAIRQIKDIRYLVKNGNMALQFESVGTCLIVRQYLERAQSVLQRDLEQRIQQLLSEGDEQSLFSKVGDSIDPDTSPAVDEQESNVEADTDAATTKGEETTIDATNKANKDIQRNCLV